MCGRIVVARPVDVLAAWFGVSEVVAADVVPRWNVAPGADVLAVAASSSGRRLGTMRWGLVPSWATDPGAGPRPVNARMETLLERPAFAESLVRRRCLVPADGFYEWQAQPDGSRQPFFVGAADGSPLAFAALWDRWRGPDGETTVSCAVVTGPTNSQLASLHDRLPVHLGPDAWAEWLDPSNTDPLRLLDLLAPPPVGALAVHPVGTRVNSTANDGPELVEVAAHDHQLPLL